MQKSGHDYLQITKEIVVAFLSNNATTAAEVAELMNSVHARLTELARQELIPNSPPAPKPVVPISNSIMPERLVCLDCGRRLKSLRFHLRSHGLTPGTYRAKWALASDYPTVAPKYAQMRSTLARESGFGRHRKTDAQNPPRLQSPDDSISC